LPLTITSSGGNVQFLYRLIEQAAAQSYGIYVAKLAGLPKNILARSQEILDDLEAKANVRQLDLFEQEEENVLQKNTKQLPKSAPIKVPDYLLKMESEIKELDILNMTPIHAMLKIQEIKERLEMAYSKTIEISASQPIIPI